MKVLVVLFYLFYIKLKQKTNEKGKIKMTLPAIHNVTAHPFFETEEFDKQLNLFYADLYSLFSKHYSGIALKHSYGFLTITPSAKQSGYMQVTHFSEDWIPNYDVQCKTVDAIIKEISGYNLRIIEIIR